MKKYILALFTITALLVILTGCGSSGYGDSTVGSANGGMATVRVSLSQDGTIVKDASSVALYSPAAALREGIQQNENGNLGARASVEPSASEGVYKPAGVDNDGSYEFKVPAGNYTFMASNGNTRAVVTGITADVSAPRAAMANLTPTGSVKGKVVDSANNAVAGAMVSLADTSCVAFSNTDGSFEMTGVPTNTAFNISAIYTADNKQMVSAAEDVTIDSSLVANLKNNLVVKESTAKTMNITGSIVAKGSGLASKVIMAVNGNIMAVALSDSNGKFSIPVTVSGTYNVAALNAATPAAQTVTVGSSDVAVSQSFVMNVAGQLAAVKGAIKLDSTRDMSSWAGKYTFDDFSIKLVGSVYTTSAKVNFVDDFLTGASVNFDFTGIPAGKYGILVDPSANGFYGSVGNITVAEGNVSDISSSNPITVKYIKPTFNAYWNDNKLVVEEILPWMDTTKKEEYFQNAVLRYCRKENNKTIELTTPVFSGNELVEANLDYSNDSEIASMSFDSVFMMSNSWSDTNTGLSGTLITESEKMHHTPKNQRLLSNDIHFVNIYSGSDFEYIIHGKDGSFSALDFDNGFYYYKNVEDAVNGNYSDVGEPLSSNMCYTGILGEKYIIVVDKNDAPESYYAKIYVVDPLASGDIYSPEPDSNIKTIDLGYMDKSSLTYHYGAIAVDNSNNAYTILFSADSSGNVQYNIYKLSNNANEIVSVCSGPLGNYGYLPDVIKFSCLNDGRFYFETVTMYPSDSSWNSAMIVSSKGIEEVSYNSDRKYCFTDKFGYMYRLQNDPYDQWGSKRWYLVRVVSLDGTVLEKSDDDYPINKLVDVAEDSNGNPVCYYINSGY